VSHDLGNVKRFCDRAILLNHGVVAADGKPQEVVDEYLSSPSGFAAAPASPADY
jgi:ABC-type polysaccharide/polyol phosphate transport system ATPase subunit